MVGVGRDAGDDVGVTGLGLPRLLEAVWPYVAARPVEAPPDPDPASS